MTVASTKKLYLHGLAASLVNLVVVSFYSLLVIRLSLTYLGKEEFGLLSLIAQVSAYISILDLGLFVAFSRILVDYNTGTRNLYANALKTASRVFHLLGLVGLLTACIIAFGGASWLSIPSTLRKEFLILMLGQGFAIWAAFSLKPLSAPVMAHGKHYLIYWITTGLTVLSAGLFWIALRGGIGIYSSFIANSIQLVLFATILWKISIPYRLDEGIRGAFDKKIFKEVAYFARDSMLWQVGGQTLASLPILLAAAWFTLSATADLSAGMKLILLLVSVTTRFGDMSVTPLSIQFANGNESAAAQQMTRIAGIAGGIGVWAALFIVCVNPAFLSWWMLEKVTWHWQSNVAGALWVAIVTTNQCMYGFAVIARRMKLLRWALLSECALYLTFAWFLRLSTGADSLMWAKPAATLIIGVYLLIQTGYHTGLRTASLVPSLARQALGLIIMIPLCVYASYWISCAVINPFLAFLAALSAAAIAILLSTPLIFTREMRQQIFEMLSVILRKIKPKGIHVTPGNP